MPTTTTDLLPYPTGTDPLGQTDLRIKELAEALDPWACRVYYSANDAVITNATETLVGYNSTTTDAHNMHDPAVNPGRITIGKAGRYQVIGAMTWDINATGSRSIRLHKNGAGTTICSNVVQAVNGHFTCHQAVCTIYCNVGDYIEMRGYQTSGGNLLAYGGEYNLWLDVRRVGLL